MEIDLACTLALAEGLGVELVSITVPHRRGHRLAGRLADVSTALAQILSGAPWKRRKEALGYLGAIRAVDLTWAEANGWHPHVHALLFFDRPLSDAERADLREWASARWASVCDRKGYGKLHTIHGVDARPVLTNADVGGYLTKVDGGWNPGRELARSDLKKSTGGRSPWQLLQEFAETGESHLAALWQEYEHATFGKRALVWSPGLRTRLLGKEAGPTDQELAASEGADVFTLVRFLVAADRWKRLQIDGGAAEFLDRCEDQAALIIEANEIDPEHPYTVTTDEWSTHA